MPAKEVTISLLPRIHLITDQPTLDRATLEEVVAVATAGAGAVQVRAKDATDRELFAWTAKLVGRLRTHGIGVLVDDRLDVALAARADGVHVGAGDLPVTAVRRLAPAGFLVGATCRDADSVRRALADGADYAGVGPIHATTTKTGLPDLLGLDVLQAAAAEGPVLAIGGLTPARVPGVLAAGAYGVAVAAAVWRDPDPPGVLREIAELVHTTMTRVVVLGGGIVGLACADELVRAGHDVVVCDPAPGRGATHAAAGMLAPAGEAWFGEEALLRLGLDSLDRWPGWAASLEVRSGIDVDLRHTGTLLVGADRDDLVEIRRTAAFLASHGLPVLDLDRAALREREPTLSDRVLGGVLLPADRHVDPRRVTAALLAVLGNRVVRQRAAPTSDGVCLQDGSLLVADVVVHATGTAFPAQVRPVRGEVVRVRSSEPPRHVLRARVHGERVYVVPRSDGEVVIGATEEEHAGRGEPLPTLGGVARLLESARSLVPGLATAELVAVVARDRPGTPDNGPLLGPLPATGGSRHIAATGHHRGGVLLAPVTAASVRAHVEGTPVPDAAVPFVPDRFDTTVELEETCS